MSDEITANKNSYKTSLMLAVLLHIILFGALFVKFASNISQPGSGKVSIVKATIISSSSYNKEISNLKHQEQQQKLAEEHALREQQIKEDQIKQQQAQQEKLQQEKIAQQQQEQQKQQQEVKHQQEVAQQRALQKQQHAEQQALIQQKLASQQAAKAAAAKIAAHKAAAEKAQQLKMKQEKTAAMVAKRKIEQKQKMLAQKQLQAAQQQMMQQQMAQEQKQLSSAAASAASAAHNQQIQSQLDKYKAAIVAAISQNWIVPGDVDKSLSCQLLIDVGPGGTVLSVKIISSSGDPALDNSAKTAVLKTSPLPVPTDPQLFDNFRELRLTVKPENIVMK